MSTPFDFSNELLLADDCVLLRPLEADDEVNLLPFALHEPDIWTYSLQNAAGEANLKQYIQTALHGRMVKKEYPFIVFDKRTHQYAGCTRFYDIQPEHASLQLGFTWYGKAFQGTGLNRHCKLLLLEFAFEQAGIERVEFRADANNARSIAAMKAIGCTVEGVLRNHQRKPEGGRRDSIVLSILKAEWENGLADRLRNRVHKQP